MSGLSARQELRCEIPATLPAVENFCAEARRWALSQNLPDQFAAELLMREALVNAAAHGCGCDPSKHIACILRLRPGRLLIAVCDQGPGFDWRAVSARTPDANACHGRGIPIFRHYAHRLRYNRRGNALIMIQRLSTEGTR